MSGQVQNLTGIVFAGEPATGFTEVDMSSDKGFAVVVFDRKSLICATRPGSVMPPNFFPPDCEAGLLGSMVSSSSTIIGGGESFKEKTVSSQYPLLLLPPNTINLLLLRHPAWPYLPTGIRPPVLIFVHWRLVVSRTYISFSGFLVLFLPPKT